jgi:pimeloyl-ACP methyl ester carboxylesterase
VLLHGFPEFWYSWRRQMRALASEGRRVVAPDQRGYNLSDKPEGVDAYRIDELAADVAGLVRHLGARRAVVAGHDWGGAVAWHLARTRPEVVERLAVLNAPHPRAYRRELRSLDQLLRSWYVFFFQLPRLPEAAIRAFDYAVLERVLRRGPTRPDAFEPDEIAAYKAALDRPGALTAAVNWYRANLRGPASGIGGGASGDSAKVRGEEAAADRASAPRDPVDVPTLVIWGMRDRYLSPVLLDGLGRWVSDLTVERLPDVGHWVTAEAPGRVSALLAGFFGDERGGP